MTGKIWRPLLVLIAIFVLCGAGSMEAIQVTNPNPASAVNLSLGQGQVILPGFPSVTLPSQGSLAVALPDAGIVAGINDAMIRPMGSIAKIMTAILVLKAHPLVGDESGPILTITQADVNDYQATIAEGGSSVAVTLGQKYSERDLLLGLLLPSANNFADLFGVWVAGNDTTFVAQMNAEALALGMVHTHFADDSGYSSNTVSTVSDLILMGKEALSNPELASLVSTQQAVLPGGLLISNIDILLGTQPGWLGVKTGQTNAAGACLLFAAKEPTPAGPSVVVVGATQGAPDLSTVFLDSQTAALSAVKAERSVSLDKYPPKVLGTVTAPWGASVTVTLGQMEALDPTVALPGGVALQYSLAPLVVTRVTKGEVVANVSVYAGSSIVATWPVRAVASMAAPSLMWRLTHKP